MVFRKLGHPLHHHLRVAQFTQAAEKRLAQLLHLFPLRIGVDREEAIGQRTAAANGDAKVVHRVGSEVLAGLVALFQRALRPVEKPGLFFACDGWCWHLHHLYSEPERNGRAGMFQRVSCATAEEAAEKRHLPCVLKGRTFRCAVQVLYSYHSEWALAHEESACRTFSAASEAVITDTPAPCSAGRGSVGKLCGRFPTREST